MKNFLTTPLSEGDLSFHTKMGYVYVFFKENVSEACL